MKLNKKAKVFSLFVVLLGIVALTHVYTQFTVKQRQFSTTVGDEAVDLLGVYQKGERALFFIDRAARYAVLQYNREIINENNDWKDAVNKNLDKYFELYAEVSIPKDNYDLSLKDGYVIGIATKNIIIKYGSIEYSVKPSFKVKVLPLNK